MSLVHIFNNNNAIDKRIKRGDVSDTLLPFFKEIKTCLLDILFDERYITLSVQTFELC